MNVCPAITLRALHAWRMVVAKDQIASLDVRNRASDFDGPPDDLVTQHRADFLFQIPRHQVTRADAARRRPHQHVAVVAQPRRKHVHNLEACRSGDNGLTHVLPHSVSALFAALILHSVAEATTLIRGEYHGRHTNQESAAWRWGRDFRCPAPRSPTAH